MPRRPNREASAGDAWYRLPRRRQRSARAEPGNPPRPRSLRRRPPWCPPGTVGPDTGTTCG
eukprot:8509639-Alexandrium_andersonii.AAC.1